MTNLSSILSHAAEWPPHPRLLFTREDEHRVKQRSVELPGLASLIRKNREKADGLLGAPLVRYEIPDGMRLLAQSRRCINTVMTCAMAYRLSGDARYAKRAEREMLAAAAFKDWNPSHFLKILL